MTIEDYLKDKNKQSESRGSSIRKNIICRTLLTISIVLFILVICNVSDKFRTYINKYVFETNYNFARIFLYTVSSFLFKAFISFVFKIKFKTNEIIK